MVNGKWWAWSVVSVWWLVVSGWLSVVSRHSSLVRAPRVSVKINGYGPLTTETDNWTTDN